MKLLITGGTVFVSRFTAEYFAEKGYDVYVLNRGHFPQPKNVHLIKSDRHSLGDILRHTYFDAVLDITAYNRKDTEHLISALGDIGDYILLSSSAVYPESLSQPFHEEQKCGRNAYWGTYGTDKIEAETCVLEKYPDAYIVRPPYLYGPMNNIYRESFVFECAESDRKFYVPNDGNMRLQFFYIGDLCRFFEILLETRPSGNNGRIFNVGNTDTVSITEWVTLCYSVLGKTPEFMCVRDEGFPSTDYFPFRNYSYVLDVSRQNKLLPELTSLSDGLHNSYEWLKNHREAVRKRPYMQYIDNNFL